MDLIFQINEHLLNFYSRYAPNSLQEPLFQIFFIKMINLFFALVFMGAVYIPLRKLNKTIKREKVIAICFGLFVNLLFLYGLNNSENSDPIRFLSLIPINILVLCFYKSGDWLKKFNIETRLDGNLNLKKAEAKNKNIVNCPSCNNKTISYWHAIKEAQTCGECGKSFKTESSRGIELALLLLMLTTFFLAFYLRAKCGFNALMSLFVMFCGPIILIIYQLKPKKLLEVEVIKKINKNV